MKSVAVIGAGISGLTAAFYVKKFAQEAGEEVDVTLLEASNRTGGKIRSEHYKGYVIEAGSNGFLDNKPWTLELCDDLGISSRLMPSKDIARRRFIYIDGRLRELPASAVGFLFSDILSWKGKLRMALEPFTKPAKEEDETIASFVRRHLGEEALRKLVAPMVSGVFAGDPYKMSLKSAFPVMAALEKEGNGSLMRAALKRMKKAKEMKKKLAEAEKQGKRVYKPGSAAGPGGVLTSFPEGIEYLTQTLASRLEDKLLLGKEAASIERSEGGYVVHLAKRGSVACDAVVVAAPAYAAASMLESLDAKVAEELRGIPYTKLAVVAFGYERSEIKHDLNGFGFLVPHEEGKTILGCLWDSSMFDNRAPEGKALLRMMVGGARAEEKALLSDEELIEACRRDLRDTMGIDAEPEMVRIYRHQRAIPQYLVGHAARLERIEARLRDFPGVVLTGNAYRGVGINDCVRQAKEAAKQVVEFITKKSPN
jgi:oxygen-dependent protoporphyrinogen oxidase